MKHSALFCILFLPLITVSAVQTQPQNAQKEPTSTLRRAVLDNIVLEYEVRGTGEPVILVHAGIFADWFKPLLRETALTDRYRVVSYHRVGYAGSSRIASPVSIAQQAAHLRSLMDHLGIERAHIIGHSSGGNIALQLALDAPKMVHSLVIMEPALPVTEGGPERMLATRPAMSPVFEAYRAGDKRRAIDLFMRGVSGPDYLAILEQAIPGAFDRAVDDANTFFEQELPALQQWSLKREDAIRITQPVLAVIGETSKEVSSIWGERQEMLLTWLPKAEGFVLSGTAHLLHVQNPKGMAEGLIAFFARHPLAR